MVNIMQHLQNGLDQRQVIILDGATGTELEKRGVPMNSTAWSGAAALTHPEVLRQIHQDYIRAGADIIITNTFGTAHHVLEPAGLGHKFEELNRQAVRLAQQARTSTADRPVAIAGSISTFDAHDSPDYRPSTAQAQANYRDQAEILAEAGVDLIMMEMMQDIEQTGYAVKAAVATGLPVWVGFSGKADQAGTVRVWQGGETLANIIAAIVPLGGSLMSIMHTLTEDTAPALRLLQKQWDGPLGAYAHSGKFIMPNWQFIDMISPEDYATEAQKWVEMGVQVVGGCCGIGPEHIRVLKEQLPTHLAQQT